jgi:Uma2 family endonuclease
MEQIPPLFAPSSFIWNYAMAITLGRLRSSNLAKVLKKLGNVPPERIGFPVGTATEEDLVRYLEATNKRLFELIDGVLVEKAMGMKEAVLATELSRHIGNFLDRNDWGLTFGADGPFRLRIGRVRLPDTGFISWDRIPGEELPDDPILEAVPNLAVEKISKSNTPEEMKLKLKDYFRAGVELVWFIYPKTQTAEIYTSLKAKQTIDREGFLDGGKVLPGFRLQLKKLFERTRKGKKG